MTDTNATNAQEHQDKLTEEEHFANLLEEMRKGNIDFSNGQYKELFDQQNSSQERTSPEDPANCRHEIVISVQYQYRWLLSFSNECRFFAPPISHIVISSLIQSIRSILIINLIQ